MKEEEKERFKKRVQATVESAKKTFAKSTSARYTLPV